MRDAFTSQGRNVARRHVDHLLKVLLFEGELRPGLAQQELLDLLGDYFTNSATATGLMPLPKPTSPTSATAQREVSERPRRMPVEARSTVQP